MPSKYLLVRRQSSGCDYTIGCGISITELQAKSLEDAKEEAVEEIGGYWKGTWDYSISSAEILVVEQRIDLASTLNQAAKRREAEKQELAKKETEEAERAEFERLKNKFSKP